MSDFGCLKPFLCLTLFLSFRDCPWVLLKWYLVLLWLHGCVGWRCMYACRCIGMYPSSRWYLAQDLCLEPAEDWLQKSREHLSTKGTRSPVWASVFLQGSVLSLLALPHYTGSVLVFAAWFWNCLLILYYNFLNIYLNLSQTILRRFSHLL